MLLLLELNEVNFDYVRYYADRGLLPHFKTLLDRHGCVETVSEQKYEELEPWIQWVTAHTGLTLAEHGVRHLGDIVHADIEQIWEVLAGKGLKVGAISPMNAKCRSDDLAFFVPDPWTRTGVIARPMVKRLYSAISQAVNDNAEARISAGSLANLAAGMAATIKPTKYPRYLKLLAGSARRPWLKSVVLDQLLADVFIKAVRQHQTDFASLFLNAAAHIQHHYLFSSAAYDGAMRNPDDYVRPGQDPLLDVYAAYDTILGDVMSAFPNARLMLATGLHQDPHPSVTYYWRLRDHAAYLRKLGVPFASAEPRMSRDFLINFADAAAAAEGRRILELAVAADGQPLFDVEDQGESLFVMLAYPGPIDDCLTYTVGNRSFADLHDDVVFVALKNGQHNGIGYFLDTDTAQPGADRGFPLSALPARIIAASEAA